MLIIFYSNPGVISSLTISSSIHPSPPEKVQNSKIRDYIKTPPPHNTKHTGKCPDAVSSTDHMTRSDHVVSTPVMRLDHVVSKAGSRSQTPQRMRIACPEPESPNTTPTVQQASSNCSRSRAPSDNCGKVSGTRRVIYQSVIVFFNGMLQTR